MWIGVFIYWVIKSRNQGVLNEIVGLAKLLFSGLIVYIPAIFRFQVSSLLSSLTVQIFGLIVTGSGCFICILAREYLASNWSGKVVTQENHALIKIGPYKFVRHPIYSGVLVMMLGASFIIGNFMSFYWVLLCFLGLFQKSKAEEKLLTEKFGESYEQYKKETKMLIPYLI